MLIPQPPFIPAPNPCSHLAVTVLRALLTQSSLGSPGAPRPFPFSFFGGLCLKFKGNSTNNPTLLQPEAPPRLGLWHSPPPPVTENKGQSPEHFPAQPQPSEECPGLLHEENSLQLIQTLQPHPAAGTTDLLKMKKQCLVLRSSTHRGGHCQAHRLTPTWFGTGAGPRKHRPFVTPA